MLMNIVANYMQVMSFQVRNSNYSSQKCIWSCHITAVILRSKIVESGTYRCLDGQLIEGVVNCVCVALCA